MPLDNELDAIFHPRSIAVAGASHNLFSMGYHYTHRLLEYGYLGQVYPISPNYEELLGLKVYPELKAVPGPVDYVICCIPAAGVLNLLDQCPQRQVRAMHMFTARFAETRHGERAALEREILHRAKEYGVRLIGPNCMGIYYPAECIAFDDGFPQESGVVGAAFQSGGASTEFVRYASPRGIRFSKVISYGNAIDLNESDFLEHLTADPETEIIACYIEGVKDGGRFLKALRRAAQAKPVVLLKGGKGTAGARAAASHTASLAGSLQTWHSAVAQAGAVEAETLTELIDLVVAFHFLPPIKGAKVGVVGGGGGRMVLSANECETAGLSVVPLPAEIRNIVAQKAPLLLDWVGNPVDASVIMQFGIAPGDVMHMVARSPEFDFIIGNLGESAPMGKAEWSAMMNSEVDDLIEVKHEGAKPLAAVIGVGELGGGEFEHWRWRLLAELRQRLVVAGVPVYATVDRAARAIRKLVDYYRWREAAGCE
ncbi:CoA-binding protein [Chloroflexota bacterium]